MKKVIVTMFAALLFVGCGGGNKSQETTKPETAMTRTLDACIFANPNYNNNDLTRSVLADSIKATFQTCRGKQLKQLNEIPFEYETAVMYDNFYGEVYEKESVGKYVVKFSYSDMGEFDSCISNNYSISLNVLAVVEKETVMQLVDGKSYHLFGTFRDFLNDSKETGIRLPDGNHYEGFPSVSYYTTFEPSLHINLGTIVLDNLTFKPAQ